MSARRHKSSRAAEILDYLKTHSQQTTGDIARGIGWTTQRVSATLWAEVHRVPSFVVKESLPPTGMRVKPTNVYTHVDFAPETTKLEPAPLPDTLATLPDTLATLPEPVEPAPPATGSLNDLADMLAQAIAQHVVSRVQAQIERQLRAILPPPADALKPLAVEQLAERIAGGQPVAKPKAASVLIAGLLPSQAGIIDAEFGDVFDLRYYMVGDNLKHLAAMAAHVDHVFTFTSKISHAVEQVMVGKGHKIHRCSGGMTMLKEQLLKLYVG